MISLVSSMTRLRALKLVPKSCVVNTQIQPSDPSMFLRLSQTLRETITNALSLRVDVHEGPDNTVVASFELPGLRKEDVSIELHNNQLTISGEAKSTTTTHSPEGEEGSKYFVRERRFGKFSRTIPLPEGTQPDSVKAAVADGVLTVTYPKATPDQSPKKIDIQ